MKGVDDFFTDKEKDIFYKVIFSRRDVRQNFIRKEIDKETLLKILKAAHHAPTAAA